MTQTLRAMRSAALLLLATSIGACDGVNVLDYLEGQPPVATTRNTRALPGSEMGLVLVNRSLEYWEYGACSHELDRLVDGAWQEVAEPRCDIFTLNGYSIHAGETREWLVPLPTIEGTYRIRFRFTHSPNAVSEEVWVVSNRFIISTTLPD